MYLVKIIAKDSIIDGKGVFAEEDIKKDTIVWKFDPNHDKTITQEKFDSLDQETKKDLLRVAYFSSESNLWVYPPEDDPARFTNHSPKNNLSAVIDKDISIEPFFVANRDIKKGEELTNNYLEFDNRTDGKVLDWKR